MTRVHLAQLLRDLASAHDYAFFSAPDEYMPSEIDRYQRIPRNGYRTEYRSACRMLPGKPSGLLIHAIDSTVGSSYINRIA